MEIALRRLDGVDQVSISMEKQEIVLTYKGSAGFKPKPLRDAVGQASVKINSFYIEAQGRLRIRGDQQFFDAGRDRFLLVNPPKMPDDKTLFISGTVLDDAVDPMELKVSRFRIVNPQ